MANCLALAAVLAMLGAFGLASTAEAAHDGPTPYCNIDILSDLFAPYC